MTLRDVFYVGLLRQKHLDYLPVLKKTKFTLEPAEESGSNPGPGENFISLKSVSITYQSKNKISIISLPQSGRY